MVSRRIGESLAHFNMRRREERAKDPAKFRAIDRRRHPKRKEKMSAYGKRRRLLHPDKYEAEKRKQRARRADPNDSLSARDSKRAKDKRAAGRSLIYTFLSSPAADANASALRLRERNAIAIYNSLPAHSTIKPRMEHNGQLSAMMYTALFDLSYVGSAFAGGQTPRQADGSRSVPASTWLQSTACPIKSLPTMDEQLTELQRCCYAREATRWLMEVPRSSSWQLSGGVTPWYQEIVIDAIRARGCECKQLLARIGLTAAAVAAYHCPYEAGQPGHEDTDGLGCVFHHLEKCTKEYGLAHMRGHSRERLMAEVKKCMIVCEMCHRFVHFLLGTWGPVSKAVLVVVESDDDDVVECEPFAKRQRV